MPDARRRALLAALVLAAPAARAHHGWSWTDAGAFRLSGVIREVRLGNPHGLLRVEAGPETWTVEVGQPWRHAEAGLPDAALAPGAEIVVEGHRAADPAELRMKAERVTVGGRTYDLYPNRS
jgi:hypothetical protein